MKQLVELMGGAVSLDSAPGRGSTFRVDLPLSAASPPRDLRLEGSAARRLLLLDDRPQSVDALGAAVASLGFAPVPAASPDEALALAPGVHAALLDGLLVTAAGGAAWVDRLRAAAGGRPQVLLRVPPGVRVPEGAAVDAVVLEPVRREELRAALAARPTDLDDAPPQAAPLTAARVLVVDDNAMNREVALAMLERLGVDADSAGSGDEALERAAAVHYDVVLMDEQMPGLDGRETTRRLRRREHERGDRRTPVVALTANAGADAETRCLAAGMDAFLSKPVRRAALRSLLSRWIPALDAPAPDAGGDAG